MFLLKYWDPKTLEVGTKVLILFFSFNPTAAQWIQFCKKKKTIQKDLFSTTLNEI